MGRDIRRTAALCAALLAGLGAAPAAAISHGYRPAGEKGAGQPLPSAVWPGPDSQLRGVVQLSGAGSSCTGSLLTPVLVLTAAHCLAAAQTVQALRFDGDGRLVDWSVGSVNRFVAHPGYDLSRQGVVQPNDIALAFLSQPMPDWVTTYALASFDRFSDINGLGAVFAGYGITLGGRDSGYSASTAVHATPWGNVLTPQLRAGVNRIERVANGGSVFLTDFDGDGRNAFGSHGYALEVGTTQGDSGSAVFYNPAVAFALHCELLGPQSPACTVAPKPMPAEYFVLGVTSFSRSSGCPAQDWACANRFGTSDGYTFIAPYRGWIEQVSGGTVRSLGLNAWLPENYGQDTALFDFVPADYQVLGAGPGLPPMPAVPEPAAAWLMLAGLALLARRRRN